ncbi:M23 family metallopeptidase [Spiribacter vilamensis]|nr:M23 family metallopeptidase [Spiribacter vilamensis]TVO62338.1 peptidoglycan DD-metalloendopeptidase family protein [Spiribacter vilamensis]
MNIAIVLLLLCLSAGAAALEMDGPLRQGGLLQGRVAPDAEVRAMGHEVPVDAEGRFVIGLGRDAPETATVTVIHADGARQQRTLRVARRDYDIQRIDGLDRNQVSPDSKTLERIRRDAAAVRSARSERLPARHFDAGWIWPLTGPVSGVFGSQRILNGEPRQPHYGIDIARPTGTPVRAPSDGVVTLAAEDLFFSGGTLILDHGQGLSSSFLHLSAMRVEPGDPVRQGQIVAEVGATGRVTGPHLDWRMNWFDQRIDPSMLVPPMQEARSE